MSAGTMPLPTLLSQVLVAFTIELDNEFERRLPHLDHGFEVRLTPGATVSFDGDVVELHELRRRGRRDRRRAFEAREYRHQLEGHGEVGLHRPIPGPSRRSSEGADSRLGDSHDTERPAGAGSVAAAVSARSKGAGKSGSARTDCAASEISVGSDPQSKLSLAICANVMRVLDEKSVRLRDLPSLSGLSKEGIGMLL
jgi:hypothetical protein